MSDLARSLVTVAIATAYSYEEILEFSAWHQREMARRRAIESMFAVLSGQGHLEEVLWFCHQRRLAVTRACWEHSGHVYRRTAYANLKADALRYAARLQYKAEHKRKRRAQTGPGYLRGESVKSSKLTATIVAEILASNESGVALAAKHKVSSATISGIRSRTKWAHVRPSAEAPC